MQVPVIHSNNVSRFLMKAGCFAMLFLVVGSAGAFSDKQNATTSTCENSTVDDAWGPEFASQARFFLAELQRTVRRNDKLKFSSLVQYPVRVFEGNHPSEIATPAALLRRYRSIMTPEMKRVILTQSSECLFANGQGVMIGDGQIWFQKQFGGRMKIITLNLRSPEANNYLHK